MLILTLRSDKPEAEVGLYLDSLQIDYKSWQAHRQLAETLHQTIHDVLQLHQKTWEDISGIVFFKGPGSFTGLRIGVSLANALAYSQSIPIVGTTGKDWIETGITKLQTASQNSIVPEYGSPPHITTPKK